MPTTTEQRYAPTILRVLSELNRISSELRYIRSNTPLFDIQNENTPAQITSNQNNYNPGDYDVLRLSSDASRDITGFSDGKKGRILILYNVGSFDIVLRHNSGSSSVGNRISVADGSDYTVSANGMAELYYDSTSSIWRLVPSSGGGNVVWGSITGTLSDQTDLYSAIREKLTGNRTYYVRTDGNDSNTGLTDSAGGAFLTLQKAADAISTLDLSTYDVTVQVRDGTYTGGVSITAFWLGSGSVTFQGNSGTPANVIISTTNADCFYTTAGTITVKDMELRTTTSGYCIRALGNGQVYYTNLRFGACAQDHVFAGSGAYIECTGDYTISGSAPCHWRGGNAGGVRCQNHTLTISGTPNFSDAFAIASIVGSLTVNGNTYTGSATGTRYKVQYNGVIYSTVTLPGNAAGSATTGGQYA